MPNAAHRTPAALTHPNVIARIAFSLPPFITQNVDGLPIRALKSSTPDIKAAGEKNPLQMHGSNFAPAAPPVETNGSLPPHTSWP
ncbi:hypothetical protein FRB93_003921 [Tulasnella sp. JGI-2019a]|nr:hypothetical protein FRB93_003921 [Tulasnella sp. JGI-2019a]